VPPGGLVLLPAPFGTLQGVIGAVLQEANKLLQITEDGEDVASAGEAWVRASWAVWAG